MSPERYRREIKRGYWYYDGSAKKGVKLDVLNYDYWLALEAADGADVSGKTPALNEQGEQYVLTWYDDVTCRKPFDEPLAGLSLEEVVSEAEMMIRQKIVWAD